MEQENNEQARTSDVSEVLAKRVTKEMLAKVTNIWCHYHKVYFIGTPGTFPTSRAHIRSFLYTRPQALAGSNNTIIRPRRPQEASSLPNTQLQITQTNRQQN